jgi:uncharacterized protein YcnI
MSTLRRRVAAAATALAALACAAPAGAHIQVTPAVVAPDDGVLFTVLVPNEHETATTQIELKLPPGALPYSFEDPPGWKHRLVLAPNKAVDRIRWTGTLPVGDFVRLVFLAGTPERPGTLTWKAIQTYKDGTKVRWIGGPDSDTPASVTTVAAGAPKQGAGGEIGGEEPATTTVAAATSGSAATAPAVAQTVVRHETDWVARALAAAALLAALAGVAVARRR